VNRRLHTALMRAHLEQDHYLAPPRDLDRNLGVIHDRAHQRGAFAIPGRSIDYADHTHTHYLGVDYAPDPPVTVPPRPDRP
jgi:hypothetical protein